MLQFNRKLPAIFLAGLTVLFAFHHWYAVTEHHAYVFVVFLVPMLWMLALGGVVYPPVFWSIGPKGKDLPGGIKAIGAILALSGLGIGFRLAKALYGF